MRWAAPLPIEPADACEGVLQDIHWAVGAFGTIDTTTDGGDTWTQQPISFQNHLYAIACPSACWTGGSVGGILFTPDAGVTWLSQASTVGADLHGISCPSPASCWAVGDAGTIVWTPSGGETQWREQFISSRTVSLRSVSCPTQASCVMVGYEPTSGPGMIEATTTAGVFWNPQAYPGTDALDGVSCATPVHCWAVARTGRIFSTSDFSTWKAEAAPTTNELRAITCPTVASCWAVGANGTIVTDSAL